MSAPTAPTAPAAPTAPPPPAPRRAQGRRRRDDTRLALLFILPATIGLLVFYFWPLVRGVWLSFTSWDLLSPAEFVGLDNYRAMVADPVFWNAVRVTLLYVVINIGLQTVVALVLAVLMQRLSRSTLLRSLVLAPYLVSNVVAALVFLWILDYQLGIGNQVLEWMGLDRIGFFTSEAWAIPTIAVVNVWRHMGYTALLIFAGLQTIPQSTYEAARVDGASEPRMFFGITLPLLRPILGLVLIISVIGSFQVFDTVAVTTDGGPVDASRVLQLYIYDKAFGQFDFGYASALSVALLLILVVVTFFQYRMTRAGQTDLS
ncbi:carbohydrate ABC transporter permease [Isoptericola sp. NPDC055881]